MSISERLFPTPGSEPETKCETFSLREPIAYQPLPPQSKDTRMCFKERLFSNNEKTEEDPVILPMQTYMEKIPTFSHSEKLFSEGDGTQNLLDQLVDPDVQYEDVKQ